MNSLKLILFNGQTCVLFTVLGGGVGVCFGELLRKHVVKFKITVLPISGDFISLNILANMIEETYQIFILLPFIC